MSFPEGTENNGTVGGESLVDLSSAFQPDDSLSCQVPRATTDPKHEFIDHQGMLKLEAEEPTSAKGLEEGNNPTIQKYELTDLALLSEATIGKECEEFQPPSEILPDGIQMTPSDYNRILNTVIFLEEFDGHFSRVFSLVVFAVFVFYTLTIYKGLFGFLIVMATALPYVANFFFPFLPKCRQNIIARRRKTLRCTERLFHWSGNFFSIVAVATVVMAVSMIIKESLTNESTVLELSSHQMTVLLLLILVFLSLLFVQEEDEAFERIQRRLSRISASCNLIPCMRRPAFFWIISRSLSFQFYYYDWRPCLSHLVDYLQQHVDAECEDKSEALPALEYEDEQKEAMDLLLQYSSNYSLLAISGRMASPCEERHVHQRVCLCQYVESELTKRSVCCR